LEGVVGECPGESHREFPVILHGEKIGVLRMRRKQTAPGWTQREEELIQEITKQLALAVNNSRLMEDTNRRIAEEQTLGAITSRLGQTLDFDTLLQTAAQELGQLQDVAEISVFVGQPPEDQKPLQKTGRLRGIP
jgi:GAF domain-containing protein